MGIFKNKSRKILEELIQYANDCINGVIISGDKHQLACKRFLKDINRVESDDTFFFYWDEEEAEKIVRWFSLLRHSKGVLAGQPIELTTWQKFVLCQIYGWRDIKTGYKRFKNAFIMVGRKNAKSQMEAGCILYEMSTQSIKNREIYECYCAGVKKEQSKIIFNECVNLLRCSPLATIFNISKTEIIHKKTGSFLKPLNKEDGQKGDGTNPAVLIIDEYHQHATTEFYDLFLGSNVKEGICMIITTAGVNLNSPCYTQEFKYCVEIVEGIAQNDRYFVDILDIDKDDDITDPKIWEKANPIRCSYEKGREDLEAYFKVAEDIPEKMNTFKTKCLNLWVQAGENKYIDMAKWKSCTVDYMDIDISNKPVYVGFDMSAKIDLTSVSFIIPITIDNIRKYILFSHSFIPNTEKLRERIIKDKQPYDLWVERGYITITNTPVVDQNVVLKYVEDFCNKKGLNIECFCFDMHNASKLMLECSDKGYTVEEVYQSHKSLNESTSGFREEVYSGNIICEYNPVLNYAMANAIIKTNNGLIKIDKDKSTSRVDPVDATLCAFKLAYYHTEDSYIDDYLAIMDEYLK